MTKCKSKNDIYCDTKCKCKSCKSYAHYNTVNNILQLNNQCFINVNCIEKVWNNTFCILYHILSLFDFSSVILIIMYINLICNNENCKAAN